MVDETNERPKLSEQLRDIMSPRGVRNRIHDTTGIDSTQLSRFFHGRGGMSMDTLDKIGEVLGLRLVLDEGDE